MLRGIADFSMLGRWQAVTTVAFLSLVAVLLPPIGYLASGVIVLITLRTGPNEAVKVLAITLATFFVLSWLVLGQYRVAGIVLLSSWLPVFLAALALGYSRSLAVSLLSITVMSLLTVIGVHLLIPDIASWWQAQISLLLQSMDKEMSGAITDQQQQRMLALLPSLLNAAIITSVMFNTVIGLLLGRSWQSRLYSPGSFGEEFRGISFGKPLTIAMIILFGLTMSPLVKSAPWLNELLLVMSLTFILKTLAIVHFWAKRNGSKSFLIAVYIMLFFMLPQIMISPVMMVIAPLLGILDEWINFRKRT